MLNRGHRRGPVLIAEEPSVAEGVRYLHLNPVWVGGLGLGKGEHDRAKVVGGLVLGEEGIAGRMPAARTLHLEQQANARRLRRRVRLEAVRQAAEAVRGAPWEGWAERSGDWGRDAALDVAVRHGRGPLPEARRQLPGLRDAAAKQAMKRFGATLEARADRRRFVSGLHRE